MDINTTEFNLEADAKTVRQAFSKFFGRNSKALISVFAYRTRKQLMEIKSEYTKQFTRDLIGDMWKKTSFAPGLRNFLKSLMTDPVEYEAECW
jgi:hypothetical protein